MGVVSTLNYYGDMSCFVGQDDGGGREASKCHVRLGLFQGKICTRRLTSATTPHSQSKACFVSFDHLSRAFRCVIGKDVTPNPVRVEYLWVIVQLPRRRFPPFPPLA